MVELQHISDSIETLGVFTWRCDDMMSSRFIVADVKIRGILKSIAGSKRLLSVFAHAAKTFNFDVEFDKAIYIKDGKKSINIPENPLSYIAFVYSLFWEIDSKNIDLHKLLDEYYAVGQNINDYYDYFNKAVVSIFADYVCQFYNDPSIKPVC